MVDASGYQVVAGRLVQVPAQPVYRLVNVQELLLAEQFSLAELVFGGFGVREEVPIGTAVGV